MGKKNYLDRYDCFDLIWFWLLSEMKSYNVRY